MPRQKKIRREPVERAIQYVSAVIRQLEGDKPVDPALLNTFVVQPLKVVEGILDYELNRD